MRKIKGIYGVEPMREGDYPLAYIVGFDGVTEITKVSYSPGPYCERVHYHIFKGEHLHSRVSDIAVAEVVFEDEAQS